MVKPNHHPLPMALLPRYRQPAFIHDTVVSIYRRFQERRLGLKRTSNLVQQKRERFPVLFFHITGFASVDGINVSRNDSVITDEPQEQG